MKKIIIGSLLVLGLATGMAYAHGNGWGGQMMGNGWNGHMMGNGWSGQMMGPGYGHRMMDPEHGGGHMMNYGNYNGCPGAAFFGEDGWNSKSHQQFLDDTVNIRKELNEKRFEFAESQRNPEANKDKLAALEKTIVGLENQLRDKAVQY